MRKLLFMVFMLCLYKSGTAQSEKITGTVYDVRDNSPIANATVRIKGGQTTQTSENGTFSIESTKEEATLEITSVGYSNQSFKARKGQVSTITLSVDTKSLNEIVVTGVGVATSKKKLGISVESITADKLPPTPSASIDQALVGKIAGAQISSVSGTPGAPTSIILRGINTIQGGTKPLILLDGVEVYSTDINSLDLSSVERIEVVQGAASATIYGAQGANGVIQLFSKKGKKVR